jgi:hypothetical protein
MLKVSVITLHTVSNYGSCLQSYATQRTIEGLGYECELVDYCRRNNTFEAQANYSLENGKLSRLAPLWCVHTFRSLVERKLVERVARFSRPFVDFRADKLHLTRRYLSEEELEADPPRADVYLTGSDQVWNSVWNEGFEEPYFLAWAPEGAHRVAWSASIGRESLDEWEIALMREALARYDAISLREASGVELVRRLGFPDARLVLDPTLMLTRDDWAEIATKPVEADGQYILVYQLNEGDAFSSYARAASDYCSLPIVKLSYRPKDAMKDAVNVVAPAVTDFLGLFLNASYVMTDSFHATAFSLNLGIPFVAIAPPRFPTRIESVLALTGTERRLLSDFGDLGLLDEPIDFDDVSQRLVQARGESLGFLKEALNG